MDDHCVGQGSDAFVQPQWAPNLCEGDPSPAHSRSMVSKATETILQTHQRLEADLKGYRQKCTNYFNRKKKGPARSRSQPTSKETEVDDDASDNTGMTSSSSSWASSTSSKGNNGDTSTNLSGFSDLCDPQALKDNNAGFEEGRHQSEGNTEGSESALERYQEARMNRILNGTQYTNSRGLLTPKDEDAESRVISDRNPDATLYDRDVEATQRRSAQRNSYVRRTGSVGPMLPNTIFVSIKEATALASLREELHSETVHDTTTSGRSDLTESHLYDNLDNLRLVRLIKCKKTAKESVPVAKRFSVLVDKLGLNLITYDDVDTVLRTRCMSVLDPLTNLKDGSCIFYVDGGALMGTLQENAQLIRSKGESSNKAPNIKSRDRVFTDVARAVLFLLETRPIEVVAADETSQSRENAPEPAATCGSTRPSPEKATVIVDCGSLTEKTKAMGDLLTALKGLLSGAYPLRVSEILLLTSHDVHRNRYFPTFDISENKAPKSFVSKTGFKLTLPALKLLYLSRKLSSRVRVVDDLAGVVDVIKLNNSLRAAGMTPFL